MLLISHRGNVDGITPSKENTIPYMQQALARGFHVETDIYEHAGELYFGHAYGDSGEKVNWDFLACNSHKLLLHCKDARSIGIISKHDLNWFCQEHDSYAISSRDLVIAHSKQGGMVYSKLDRYLDSTIIMLPEKNGLGKKFLEELGCVGVCSDIISFYE
jgi:hypothetical protein